MVQFWSLRALQEDGNTLADSSVLPIHIHKGENYIGRMDLKNSSKQVSRKHVSITASSQGNLQIFVVGCIFIFFPLCGGLISTAVTQPQFSFSW
jgi:hypothetical protein